MPFKNMKWEQTNTDYYDHSVLYQNPCKKDCPNRNSECHAKCEKYAKYRKERDEMLAEKNKQNY